MEDFKIGDKVSLPFNETGTIVKILDLIWGFNYIVKIRKATFNKTNERIEFRKQDLKLEKI